MKKSTVVFGTAHDIVEQTEQPLIAKRIKQQQAKVSKQQAPKSKNVYSVNNDNTFIKK